MNHSSAAHLFYMPPNARTWQRMTPLPGGSHNAGGRTPSDLQVCCAAAPAVATLHRKLALFIETTDQAAGWTSCGLAWLARPGERSLIRSCRHGLRASVAVGALAVSLGARAGTGVPDTQLWTELDVTGTVATDTTLTGIAKVRASESLPNPTLTALEADLNHKLGDWWLSLGYAHEVTPARPEETIEGRQVNIKQVLRLFGSRAWRFGRNTVALRLRLDDTLDASSNPYRARIRIEYRRATAGLSWMSYLFASDEVFYEFQDQAWFRNRFRAGANLVLSERTELLVFYQRQDSNNSTPGAINALGLTLDVTFK